MEITKMSIYETLQIVSMSMLLGAVFGIWGCDEYLKVKHRRS